MLGDREGTRFLSTRDLIQGQVNLWEERGPFGGHVVATPAASDPAASFLVASFGMGLISPVQRGQTMD